MTRSRFTFPYSHAFNGGHLIAVIGDDPTEPTCLVEFADGTTVIGEMLRSGMTWAEVTIPEYVTAKGTVVSAKTWCITRHANDLRWQSRLLE
ncbi:MAG: hypothetical protein QM753_09375 [Thermomicrobiales bacterium]